MILESFHKAGTNPEDKDLLNINVLALKVH